MTTTTTTFNPSPDVPLPAGGEWADDCPICAVQPEQPCRNIVNGQERPPHWSRSIAEVSAR